MADAPNARLRRRIAAARSLADDLADQGHARMAQVIRDLCKSAEASSNMNSRLHAELMELRNG